MKFPLHFHISTLCRHKLTKRLVRAVDFLLPVAGLACVAMLCLQRWLPGYDSTAKGIMWLNFACLCFLLVWLGWLLRLRATIARRLKGSIPGFPYDHVSGLPSRVLRWSRRGILVLLLGVGALACFYRISCPSLWHDEIIYAPHGFMSGEPVGYALCQFYYIITGWSTQLFENKEFALRAPQAASAVLSLLFVYLLGRHLYSTGAGCLAVIMLFTSQFYVRYAQENRAYQMGTLCFLAMYYFFVRFLETRKWYMWFGFVAMSSLFLRTHYFGIVSAGVLGLLTLLLIPMQCAAKPGNAPYELHGRVFVWLIVAGIIIVLLWMPNPMRFFGFSLNRGAIIKGTSHGWREYIPVTVSRFLYCIRASFIPLGGFGFTLLMAAAVAGSLLYRKGRGIVFLLYAALVTLVVFYIMNTQRVADHKRYMLYLFPVLTICVGGGIDVIARVIRDGVMLCMNCIPKWKLPATATNVCAKGAQAVVWIVLLWMYVLPAVGDGLHRLGQYYFEDREFYRLAGRVLTEFAKPADEIWLCRPGHITDYVPKSANLRPRVRTHSSATIGGVLRRGKRLWVFARDADTNDFSSYDFATIPILKMWKGHFVLFLFDPDYAADNPLRIRDEETILRFVVESNFYPRVEAAARLTDVLLERGATNEADAVAARIADVSTYRIGVNFATSYFARRILADEAYRIWRRHANCYFWMAEPQLRVAWSAYRAGDNCSAVKYAKRALRLDDGLADEALKIIRRASAVPSVAEDSSLPNMLKNGSFEDGLTGWRFWQNAKKQTNLLTVVEAESASPVKEYLRIENPGARLAGISQTISVSSGSVYRLCGVARSTAGIDSSTLFGGRLGFWLPPQKEKQIVWMSEYNKWWPKELVFTNEVDGTATVYVHMGYGNVPSTGEFTNIRFEELE